MSYEAGLIWRKWDLHVHTPASIIQHYGGASKDVWDRYIDDLEALSPEYKVIGINDYLFLDGYRKVLEYKEKGRLKNIDLFLPVLEFRIDKFGGSKSQLSKANFHVIFSNTITPDTIEAQFIAGLGMNYSLSPKFGGKNFTFSGKINRQSIEELGRQVIGSVPEAKKGAFDSPMIEGFNALCLNLRKIVDLLSTSFFQGKYLTAIGLNEWADIKWSSQSIAEKKSLINDVDFVFVSSPGMLEFESSRNNLKSGNVNDLLLHFSDAHYYSSSKEKDRIGNSMTWIKSDPTFLGLKMIMVEPAERIFVGDYPDELSIQKRNSTRYIRSVEVRKIAKSKLKEIWFNNLVPLNSGFISIIGKKGSGKSALSDTLGLLGNSKNEIHFSFLNDQKFRKKPLNRAGEFEATVVWLSGQSLPKNLATNTSATEVEKVRYLPQEYFEKICTELSDIDMKESGFYKEIKKVIYSHIDSADRLGLSTFDEISDKHTRVIKEGIEKRKIRLAATNKEIAGLEGKLTPQYIDGLKHQLMLKNEEISASDRNKPKKVAKPKGDGKVSGQIKDLESKRGKLEQMIGNLNLRKGDLTKDLAELETFTQAIQNFVSEYQGLINQFGSVMHKHSIDSKLIIKLEHDLAPLETIKQNIRKDIARIKVKLDPKNPKSEISKQKAIDSSISNVRKKMGEKTGKYQAYLDELDQWREQKARLIGSIAEQGSQKFLENEIKQVKKTPKQLGQLYEKRIAITQEIYHELEKIKKIFIKLYSGVEKVLDEQEKVKELTHFNISVSIENLGFRDTFFDYVDRRKIYSALDRPGDDVLGKLILAQDYNSFEGVSAFLDELEHKILRAANDQSIIIGKIKRGKELAELYDYIYSLSYLNPNYVLRMGERELTQLSPGERGTLLLIFYLLLDQENIPLIIDQPEHNLDNDTVYNLLVPAIKASKRNRQIIIITHNPNIAVVSCSDQIICATLDIEEGYEINYISGSIENPPINKFLLNILEGSRPALDKRNENYIPEELLPFFQ